MYYISGTYTGDFNLDQFFMTKLNSLPILYFKRTLWKYLMAIFNKSAKLNVHQSVFIVKLTNFMSTEYTTSTYSAKLWQWKSDGFQQIEHLRCFNK